MKLGTLRFSRRHRAARTARAVLIEARLHRAQRLAEAQARLARCGLTPEQIDVLNQARAEIKAIVRGGGYLTGGGAKPHRRSWWERLTGGRTTIIYGER